MTWQTLWPCREVGNQSVSVCSGKVPLQRLGRKWHISSFQSASSPCPSSKAKRAAVTLLKSGQVISPYCLITSDQSSLHVVQPWNRLNISSPTELQPPGSLHPWHRSGKTTPPMLLIPGCPGHKDKVYLVSKSLTISNWSTSEKNVSSKPRLMIITIALL